MEACGSAHDQARESTKLGHTVKLMPPKYVKAYVTRGKTGHFLWRGPRLCPPAVPGAAPDHADRLVRFERHALRTEPAEGFAVYTPDELQPILDGVEAKARGRPIGVQILADTH